MKASLFLTSLFGLQALAFPTLGSISSKLKNFSDEDLARITELADKISVDIKKRQLGLDLLPVVVFDPVAQKVDTTGQYEYRKPRKNDIRGSCPGLNMMANHGYISRDGVDSVVNIIMASQKMFGMGHDLATYLTTYAALVAGDLMSVSIGGPPPSRGLLSGLTRLASDLRLLGKPQGLSRSHNRFENDMSPTREDLYLGNHDVDSVNIRQFKELAAMELGPRGYDLSVMTKFRGERYKWTIANNPYFFAGPLTHYALNTGTYVFTYRLMANHSAEYPDGYLDLETLMSMEGVKRDANGEFVFEWGSERIPENYYKRAIGDDFSIPAFGKDALYQLQQLPFMAVAGGNMGKVNTFTGLDIANLTGGIFNAKNIFEGNNAMCLAFTASMQVTPDLLRGLVGNVLLAVQSLTKVLDPIFEQLGCPQQAKFDSTAYGAALGQYPGAKGGAI